MVQKVVAIEQVFDEKIFGRDSVIIHVSNTKEEAEAWISDRKRVPCYAQDNYVASSAEIDNGRIKIIERGKVC